MSNQKSFTIEQIRQIVIDSAIQTVKNEIWSCLKQYIDEQVRQVISDKKFPSKWLHDVFNNIRMQNVYYDDSSGQIRFQIASDGISYYQTIQAKVIDEGNHQHGGVYTAPGKTSFGDYKNKLTNRKKNSKTLRGRPVVWVHNNNAGKKYKTTKVKYNHSTGQVKHYESTVTTRQFYPIFEPTLLPAQFNKQGIHLMQNVVQRSKDRVQSLFDEGIAKRVYKLTGYDLRQG